MLRGAYVFVAVIFLAMAMSFIATTAVLAWEFWSDGWVDLMATDSHLFVFFPTFGIIALAAFYLPSVAFVDHYWRHVWLGKVRFLIGAAVMVVIAHGLAQLILSSSNHSIWEVKPQVLRADSGEPARCTGLGNRLCERVALGTALSSLRELGQTSLGLTPFVRDCSSERLIEPKATQGPARYCVATNRFSSNPPFVDDVTCCQAMDRLQAAVNGYYDEGRNQSLTRMVHAWLLPLKAFFLLILLSISIMLTVRFKGIAEHYAHVIVPIELGLIVGTVSVLFFPLLSQAFLKSLAVLFGENGKGVFSLLVPYLSAAFGIWTILIFIFFFRRKGDNFEMLTKAGSLIVGAVALVNYDEIVAWIVRIIGAGAPIFVLAGVAVAAVVAIAVTVRLLSWAPQRSR